MKKKLLATAVAGAIVGMAPMTASAVNFKDVMSGDVDFSIGGYVKLNVMSTAFDQGDTSGNGLLDTFYFPGSIPTGASGANGDAGENSRDLQFSARETRINFKASKKVGGHSLLSYIEMDFMPNGDGSGNELISNSYSPRMRHAFLKFDNWLFGQTWSTFMDTGALPESVDFLAASESTVFIRQPQIRYSNGGFQIALENSYNFFSGSANNNTLAGDRDDSDLPDLALNYTHKADWGHLRLNGLLREVVSQNNGALSDDTAIGWAVGLTGKVMFGKDDLKFSVNVGEGVGRYIGLALPLGATVDPTGDLDLTETVAFFAAYRHWWTDQWRSSIIYSDLDVDYDTGGAGQAALQGTTSDSTSIAINLIYSPVKKLDLGIMYIDAERELDNGNEGDMDRIQFSAKYAF